MAVTLERGHGDLRRRPVAGGGVEIDIDHPIQLFERELLKRLRNGRAGDLKAEEVARMFKVSRRTLFRGLKAAQEHDAMLAVEA